MTALRSRSRHTDGDYGGHRSRGSRRYLIRNAEALEIFGKVDTLIIDKTGTLTEGKPTLSSINPQPGSSALSRNDPGLLSKSDPPDR
jgi:P-type E1-E2 ATPase